MAQACELERSWQLASDRLHGAQLPQAALDRVVIAAHQSGLSGYAVGAQFGIHRTSYSPVRL